MLLYVLTGHGQSLQWNPAQSTSGPSDGGGSWLASKVWWNGTTIVNGTWASATPNGAIFGAGTSGNYTVTLSSPVIASNDSMQTVAESLTDGTAFYRVLVQPNP